MPQRKIKTDNGVKYERSEHTTVDESNADELLEITLKLKYVGKADRSLREHAQKKCQ